MSKLNKKHKLVGFRVDYDGEGMQLYSKGYGEYSVSYKGELQDVELTYEMMPSGTYNQETDLVPYFVLDNNIYVLNSFNVLGNKRRV